ncbi:MAG: hypothetical protein H6625_12535 [Bdellovibrionaceae bacterium]|nr:hypothetical protein [Pseudobdellovibrionaceae bacterium]MCB9025129.1 hypothetical protein [Pseudobdellovibrionaceae bacterium]MCB9025864.1 hypothetical protein [Pseudobdellovibrionaceae bacterium]MCB9026103.1 hypothetical protein [Pseudobdellovibrionaceae bacterium]MCB9026489.1 hypothetical protein [Pseudobdellovibrionaceae bacterium]
MDMEILRKKISTFRGKSGRVRITDDQLYMEILSAWEQWSGTTKDFYKSVGVSKTGMAGIIGKAKRMRREGHFPVETFKEVRVESPTTSEDNSKSPITMKWERGRVIRFSQVDQLVEFLNKVEKKVA